MLKIPGFLQNAINRGMEALMKPPKGTRPKRYDVILKVSVRADRKRTVADMTKRLSAAGPQIGLKLLGWLGVSGWLRIDKIEATFERDAKTKAETKEPG